MKVFLLVMVAIGVLGCKRDENPEVVWNLDDDLIVMTYSDGTEVYAVVKGLAKCETGGANCQKIERATVRGRGATSFSADVSLGLPKGTVEDIKHGCGCKSGSNCGGMCTVHPKKPIECALFGACDGSDSDGSGHGSGVHPTGPQK